MKKRMDRQDIYRNVEVYSGWRYFSLSTDITKEVVTKKGGQVL